MEKLLEPKSKCEHGSPLTKDVMGDMINNERIIEPEIYPIYFVNRSEYEALEKSDVDMALYAIKHNLPDLPKVKNFTPFHKQLNKGQKC